MNKLLTLIIFLAFSSGSLAEDMFENSPVIYPPAKEWKKMSKRRIQENKLLQSRIHKALNKRGDYDFNEIALSDVIKRLGKEYGISVFVSKRSLTNVGVKPDMPISISMSNVSLKTFLNLLLKEYDLTYTIVSDEVLKITSIEDAESNLITRVYPPGEVMFPWRQ